MTYTEEKSALRKVHKELRAARAPALRVARDDALCRAMIADIRFVRANEVFLYCPIGAEINVLPVAAAAWAAGKTVAFPRTSRDREMVFCPVRAMSELLPARFGLSEPAPHLPPLQPGVDTLVLVPALCFDRDGYRLGYGGGYYDRYLASFACCPVGVVYTDDILSSLPREAHDFRVTALVTEKGVYSTRGNLQ